MTRRIVVASRTYTRDPFNRARTTQIVEGEQLRQALGPDLADRLSAEFTHRWDQWEAGQ